MDFYDPAKAAADKLAAGACDGDYTKPGDAGHSVLTPKAGDFRGDKNVADGSFFDHPIDAIAEGADRFVSYGNWSGPGNKFDKDIKAKFAKDPNYDPSKDASLGKGTAVDGLDAAARAHDLQYYKDNGDGKGGDKAGMFSLDGVLNTADADRKLQQTAAKEMATPSMGKDGKPINYSDNTRAYADGMQGFFGGRADGVDIRKGLMSGKMDAGDAANAAVNDVSKAYNKNGGFGAACEVGGLANVAGAQAIHSINEAGSSAVNSVSNGMSKAYDWIAN